LRRYAVVQKHKKVFVSWSGGKDSSFSCYRIMQDRNIKVAYLLNMMAEDGKRSRSHGLSATLLKSQAEAMGIPIIQRKATWNDYEEEYKKALSDFKKEGLGAGVFGDIDLQEHRDWVERVCNGAGLKAFLPLWEEEREKLIEQFISCGFKSIVVVTNQEFMGKEWLGRIIDRKFVRDLKLKGGIDLCGEKGEYHTFVYDGPIFKKPVKFAIGKKILRDKHWFLEILPK